MKFTIAASYLIVLASAFAVSTEATSLRKEESLFQSRGVADDSQPTMSSTNLLRRLQENADGDENEAEDEDGENNDEAEEGKEDQEKDADDVKKSGDYEEKSGDYEEKAEEGKEDQEKDADDTKKSGDTSEEKSEESSSATKSSPRVVLGTEMLLSLLFFGVLYLN